jgi:hypothetical protein
MKPKFPLTVFFLEDKEEWVLDNEEELACNLEWFDSADEDENAIVTDSLGRNVRLKIMGLKVIICRLEDG